MKPVDNRDCWDAAYRLKGCLYGGAPHPLPRLPAGARVLELGCGNGKSLLAMMHYGWLVTAMDFSPRAAFLARATTLQGTEADIAVADGKSIPFRDRSFDAVVACHILGHSEMIDRRRIAGEICRVIRPGGQLWFRDFSTQDFRAGTGRETEPGTRIRGTGILTHYFTDTEVTGLFSGLVPLSVQSDEWTLRVRGEDYHRSEIVVIFNKTRGSPYYF
ncbi:MAG: class I SAM-dependent methyltransferase [Methanoregula sp.]|nr:class I SAM-dependent methyltransferase [Methanoregula sp.]